MKRFPDLDGKKNLTVAVLPPVTGDPWHKTPGTLPGMTIVDPETGRRYFIEFTNVVGPKSPGNQGKPGIQLMPAYRCSMKNPQ